MTETQPSGVLEACTLQSYTPREVLPSNAKPPQAGETLLVVHANSGFNKHQAYEELTRHFPEMLRRVDSKVLQAYKDEWTDAYQFKKEVGQHDLDLEAIQMLFAERTMLSPRTLSTKAPSPRVMADPDAEADDGLLSTASVIAGASNPRSTYIQMLDVPVNAAESFKINFTLQALLCQGQTILSAEADAFLRQSTPGREIADWVRRNSARLYETLMPNGALSDLALPPEEIRPPDGGVRQILLPVEGQTVAVTPLANMWLIGLIGEQIQRYHDTLAQSTA